MKTYLLLAQLLLSLVMGPQDDRVIITSYVPPNDLRTFTTEADVIAAIHVLSVKPWTRSAGRRPYVEYTATVDDLIKSDPRLSPGGESVEITFLEVAGEISTPHGRANTGVAATLEPSEKAVVFLRWTESLDKFQLAAGPHAIYKTNGSVVRAAARSEMSQRNSRLSTAEFIAQLKQLVKVKK